MNNLKLEKALEDIDLDVYFSILENVVYADGVLHKEQMEYLRDQAVLLKYNLDKLKNNSKTIENINWKNVSNVTKNIIIRDCIVIANSNGEYHKDEVSAIKDIAKKMGLKESKVKEIEEWLSEYCNVMQRAESILFK